MKKIFVLERNKDIADIISIVLTEGGYEVKTTRSAAELQTALLSSIPHAILLDVISPYTEEAEFCRKLKESERTSKVPIIVLSTNTNVTSALSVICADGVISKPFNLDDLINTVENCVEV